MARRRYIDKTSRIAGKTFNKTFWATVGFSMLTYHALKSVYKTPKAPNPLYINLQSKSYAIPRQNIVKPLKRRQKEQIKKDRMRKQILYKIQRVYAVYVFVVFLGFGGLFFWNTSSNSLASFIVLGTYLWITVCFLIALYLKYNKLETTYKL